MRAIIMAGGKGTRMSGINNSIPKPMLRILDKPILEYQIENLAKCGIKNITIVVGYLKEAIIDYFEDGKNYGVTIDYFEEQEPLGTAGALYYFKDISDDFFLIFGDLLFDIDFKKFMTFHKRNEAIISLFVHPNSHPYDSDIIEIDQCNHVTGILSKKTKRNIFYHNLVNAGLYCISPNAFQMVAMSGFCDLEKDVVSKLISKGVVYAYRSTEYVKDMGTPDRLKAVTEDVKNRTVFKRSLQKSQKAIFLDRDGTINQYVGFLRKPEDFRLLPDAAQAISLINKSDYLTIVVTNQPVIARGEVTFKELDIIHKKMETDLGMRGAYVDDVFFCPHHPDKGFEGEVSELKIECNCRKPKTGMIELAVKRYGIDIDKSWIIGDTGIDIQTGENAHLQTIFVQTGMKVMADEIKPRPTYIANSLLDAVEYILNR